VSADVALVRCFSDDLSTTGFSYEGISGLGGCVWVCGGVCFFWGWARIMVALKDVLDPFFLSFHKLSWKTLSPFLVGVLPLGKFCFLHFVVIVFVAFSSALLAPTSHISV
jgi:hypothetical protein